MAFLGLFGKKQQLPEGQYPASQEGLQGQPAPNVTNLPSLSESAELDLPNIPPIDELDLPPPPTYPSAKPTPRPEIPSVPRAGEMYPSDAGFGSGINIPVEELTGRRPQQLGLQIGEQPSAREEGSGKGQEQRRESDRPMYVRVDDYKAILEGTSRVRDNLKEATDVVTRMNELKNEEDKEFEKWRAQLEDIQRKLTYVDKIIFESS